jgi:predicted metalloprotease
LNNIVNGRAVNAYLLDLFYGASKYPCGWVKPQAVIGYFCNTDKGNYQNLFFKKLIKKLSYSTQLYIKYFYTNL